MRRTGQFAKGVGESALDTAKLVVDIPVVAAKVLGKGAHSLVTWEDKLGIGKKVTEASEVVKAFCKEVKQDWENPEEYRARLEKAQALRKELDTAEQALNAEAYHNRDARNLGYWSGEALQAVFGAEVVKGGVKLAKGAQKAAKVAKATKVAKAPPAAATAEKGVARVAKAGEAAQQAENIESTAKVAKAAEGVEGAARIEQIIQGATPQVQEAYSSVKDWLGEGCRMVRNDERGMVLMSKDNLRKFRFDFDTTTSEGKCFPTHMHLEELRNGEWCDAVKGLHKIYPKGN